MHAFAQPSRIVQVPRFVAVPAIPPARGRRVQRRRGKRSEVPAGAVYVGRPTMWGNPFAGRQWKHAKSVILHRKWLRGEIAALTLEKMGFCPKEIDALTRLRSRVLTKVHSLAGLDLACWCPLASRWCHADTLLELAPVHAGYERHAL